MKYYEAAMRIMIIARLSWAHLFSLFYQIMGSGSAIQIQMDRGAAVFVSRGNGQLSGVVKTNCVINFVCTGWKDVAGKFWMIATADDCRGWLLVV